MGKGKEKEMEDKDLDEERAWVLFRDIPMVQEFLAASGSLKDPAPGGSGTAPAEVSASPEGGGLECGCCFSPAPFVCIPCPN
jgi:hypothetical protein